MSLSREQILRLFCRISKFTVENLKVKSLPLIIFYFEVLNCLLFNLFKMLHKTKLSMLIVICNLFQDVNILKKRDGKMVGCAFVQFASVAEARFEFYIRFLCLTFQGIHTCTKSVYFHVHRGLYLTMVKAAR